jgi:hypothetical protein
MRNISTVLTRGSSLPAELTALCSPRMKTDGMNPVSSVTVYRFFSSVFVFSGINGNGTKKRDGVNGNGTENGRAFVRPYLQYPVFNRDIPFFIPFFFDTG